MASSSVDDAVSFTSVVSRVIESMAGPQGTVFEVTMSDVRNLSAFDDEEDEEEEEVEEDDDSVNSSFFASLQHLGVYSSKRKALVATWKAVANRIGMIQNEGCVVHKEAFTTFYPGQDKGAALAAVDALFAGDEAAYKEFHFPWKVVDNPDSFLVHIYHFRGVICSDAECKRSHHWCRSHYYCDTDYAGRGVTIQIKQMKIDQPGVWWLPSL